MTPDTTDLTPHLDPNRRQDAVLLFDITNGNPNGDPDAGNQPRVNPNDLRGLVSDVALKRKVRNYIVAARPADSENDGDGENARYKIYVEEGVALNGRHRRAYSAVDLPAAEGGPPQPAAQRWMCENFFDVRMFGAVMSMRDHNCGQVKGPFQIGIATSIDAVLPIELAITRVAVTREEELTKLWNVDEKGGKDREMGRKAIIPYGLYRANIYYSPHYGQRSGVTSEDLALFWRALVEMWDLDRSSARADMACRGLFVFSHDNPLGNAPAHKLLEQVRVAKIADAELPSQFSDYQVLLPDPNALPEGVTLSGDLA